MTRPAESAKTAALAVGMLELAGLALAEFITFHLNRGLGSACHALLAAAAILMAVRSAARSTPERERLGFPPRTAETGFFVVLALPPLTRLVMLAMPVREFSEIGRYGVIGLALAGTAWVAARANGYDRRAVGLVLARSPLGLSIDLVVALSGVAIGYFEYSVGRPDVEIDVLDPDQVVFASLAILVGVGFVEALLTRGVIQIGATRLFGPIVGVTFTAATIAVLQVGYRSWRELLIVLAGSVVLGAAFRASGSLLGVGLAYAVANVCLFAVFPHVPDLPTVSLLVRVVQGVVERLANGSVSSGTRALEDLAMIGPAFAAALPASIRASRTTETFDRG